MGSARTRRGIRDYSSRCSLITAAITRPTAKDIPLNGRNRWTQKREKANQTGGFDKLS